MNEPRTLDPDLMRALVRNPAWKELMQSYLLPTFTSHEQRSYSQIDAPHAEFMKGTLLMLRGVIEQPYKAAGIPSPLERRYEFDEDLTQSSSGKRPYKKRQPKPVESPVIPMPSRSSFAV